MTGERVLGPNAEHEFDNGFGYEPDDRSVGIYGGFYHLNEVNGLSDVCESTPEEDTLQAGHTGQGANRTLVTTMSLYCPDCDVSCTPFDWVEWDPEMSEEDD